MINFNGKCSDSICVYIRDLHRWYNFATVLHRIKCDHDGSFGVLIGYGLWGVYKKHFESTTVCIRKKCKAEILYHIYYIYFDRCGRWWQSKHRINIVDSQLRYDDIAPTWGLSLMVCSCQMGLISQTISLAAHKTMRCGKKLFSLYIFADEVHIVHLILKYMRNMK